MANPVEDALATLAALVDVARHPEAAGALATVCAELRGLRRVEKTATRLSTRLNFRGEDLDELAELDAALDAVPD